MSDDKRIGTVKWFNDSKGYGFATSDGVDGEVFLHYASIINDVYKTLAEGDVIDFVMVDGPEGPLATQICKLLDEQEES